MSEMSRLGTAREQDSHARIEQVKALIETVNDCTGDPAEDLLPDIQVAALFTADQIGRYGEFIGVRLGDAVAEYAPGDVEYLKSIAANFGVPQYTASFDAVLRLLPVGFTFSLAKLPSHHYYAEVTGMPGSKQSWHSSGLAASPAIALLLAILRSKLGQEGV